jgi:Putative adhesin
VTFRSRRGASLRVARFSFLILFSASGRIVLGDTLVASGPGGGGSTDVSVSTARALDAREVIVPIAGAERMRIDNPLGNVTVRAWDRNDAIHITAEKRSTSPEALGRLRVHFTAWAGGEISVETRVEMGGRERALPLAASRVDLVIEVPAALQIEAKTFAGDLSATGLRSGVRLETTGGRIGISDVHGRVVTHQLRGGQNVVAVEGDVDLDGVEGHMKLERLVGARVEARVVDGDIHAENIRSDEVRLSATTGAVVLVGLLRPNAHYDLRSYDGEVRLAVVSAASGTPGFEIHVRSPSPVLSDIPLRTLWQKGDRLRAVAAWTGKRVEPGNGRERALVELSSVLGRVVLTSAQAVEAARVDGQTP